MLGPIISLLTAAAVEEHPVEVKHRRLKLTVLVAIGGLLVWANSMNARTRAGNERAR